jgi:hypothetical protein
VLAVGAEYVSGRFPSANMIIFSNPITALVYPLVVFVIPFILGVKTIIRAIIAYRRSIEPFILANGNVKVNWKSMDFAHTAKILAPTTNSTFGFFRQLPIQLIIRLSYDHT